MKYQVRWVSPKQGLQKTTVDAISPFAAREQVDSMYSHVEGYNVLSVAPVFEKKESPKVEQPYNSDEYHNNESSGDDEFSVIVGTMAIFLGVGIAFLGLFFLPVGIIAMVIGGAVGWIGWKLACWLSDKGW